MTDTLISAAQLQRFAPPCFAVRIAPLLDAEARRCAIDTARRLSHWLAQISVESGQLDRLVENMNYSAERLVQVWPARFPSVSFAARFAHNPPALANHVYAGRLGNGPEASGDGWMYRGRGFLMRTGRSGYVRASAATGLDLIAHPDLLQDYAAAAKDAADYWRTANINPLADADDVAGVTRAVNGGVIGLGERVAALSRAKAIWGG